MVALDPYRTLSFLLPEKSSYSSGWNVSLRAGMAVSQASVCLILRILWQKSLFQAAIGSPSFLGCLVICLPVRHSDELVRELATCNSQFRGTSDDEGTP